MDMKLVLPPFFRGVPSSLLWAVALSMALHAAMLLSFARPHVASGVALSISTVKARLMFQSAVSAMAITATVDHAAARPAPAVPDAPLAPRQVARTDPVAPPPSSAPTVPEEGGKQGLHPAPEYRVAQGLDPSPRPLQSIDPEYPASAGWQEGRVVLRLLIGSSGDVDEVAVVHAAPPGLFEESALQAFGKAKFSPGYFLGIPVKSQIFIEVGYTPINRGAAVSGPGR